MKTNRKIEETGFGLPVSNRMTELMVDAEDLQLLSTNMQIDGVDLDAGLERFGGDCETYLHVLRSYAVNTRNLLGSLNEVTEENLNGYAITVHGIKGSSRSICADLAGDKAEELEVAAKSGDLDFVREKNPALVSTVAKLLDDLEELLAKITPETDKPEKEKPDKELLARILEACKSFDMDMVETLVKELESFDYKSNGEIVGWLSEYILQYNVDDIIEKLTEELENR